MRRVALALVASFALASAPGSAAAQQVPPFATVADLVSELLGAPAPVVAGTPSRAARAVRGHRGRPGSQVSRHLPAPAALLALVDQAAGRHGVPAALAHAVVRVESGYRCHAVSRGGARGIMQILPRSARGVGVAGDLTDCAIGLEAGMRYLRLALAAGGAGCVGASLYNTGLAAPRRCTGYGRRVMALAGRPIREARR